MGARYGVSCLVDSRSPLYAFFAARGAESRSKPESWCQQGSCWRGLMGWLIEWSDWDERVVDVNFGNWKVRVLIYLSISELFSLSSYVDMDNFFDISLWWTDQANVVLDILSNRRTDDSLGLHLLHFYLSVLLLHRVLAAADYLAYISCMWVCLRSNLVYTLANYRLKVFLCLVWLDTPLIYHMSPQKVE